MPNVWLYVFLLLVVCLMFRMDELQSLVIDMLGWLHKLLVKQQTKIRLKIKELEQEIERDKESDDK